MKDSNINSFHEIGWIDPFPPKVPIPQKKKGKKGKSKGKDKGGADKNSQANYDSNNAK